MTPFKFIIKSLWFFRRQHLAVFAGTVISTAVLTGALIIGDSVRNSLNELVALRLGKTAYAMHTGDRFVRAQLAAEMAATLQTTVSPLLSMPGVAVNSGSDIRANGIQVLGVDNTFWQLQDSVMPSLEKNEVFLSQNLAQKLKLEVGDRLLLRVEKGSVIPLNAPFVSESDPSVALRCIVKGIAGEHNLGRFSLKSNQVAPYNVFISHEYLSEKLELEGLANLLLVAGQKTNTLTAEKINNCFEQVWQLADAGLRINQLPESGELELLSDRVFIDPPVAQVVSDFNIQHTGILTYLVNTISANKKATPYSFVTADSSPIVPPYMKADEIIINDWLAEDLAAQIGDSVVLDYYVMGPLRRLQEKSSRFVILDIIPVVGNGANESLMPSFPGMSEAGSCSDWKTGIPVDLKRVRDKDEAYWKKNKGTPKAFIPLQTGIKLWQNKFGSYTAFRFKQSVIKTNELTKAIRDQLAPERFNLLFLPVQNEGLQAANNMVDFGGLFLSLSFFIIAAGVLLTLLIYALNTEARTQEIGVLAGLGFNRRQIIYIRFKESAVTALLGGGAGALLGIVYNYGILAGLNSVWQEVVKTDMLMVHIRLATLLTGAISGIVIALAAIWFVTCRKLQQPVVGLIKDTKEQSLPGTKHFFAVNLLIVCGGFLGAAALIGYAVVSSVSQNAGLLLTAGGLFLIGCVAGVNLYFEKQSNDVCNSVPSLTQLALKNAGRNRGRSITTILLLALGIFSIIITGANRKTFSGTENVNQSGTGGYQFWAETTLPVLYDLNTAEGKVKVGLSEEDGLDEVEFMQFHCLEGDDASCLNLNQVRNPQILGFNPETFDRRQSFSFAALSDEVDPEHPWLALKKSEGEVIPAYADMTVITWGLKKSIGDTLTYLNEEGHPIKLRLMGGLKNSIFQGNILIDDDLFRKHYPSVSGSRLLLVDASLENKSRVAELLDSNFQDYGIRLSSASQRLAAFYSVENTYLTVFMLLGGLGIILGTLGLGIVLLRNMLERKQEIAVLMAMGYERKIIFKLIFIENLFLLITGMSCGIGAATVGILPSLLSPAYIMPGLFVATIIAVIFISGVIWIWIPTATSMKGNLIEALKNE
ncbi:ABC transporter permease [Marinilabiliaceae bacterium JC017]|nr:ABC transporter permease [Marinilabiliaceae bacterium JC017]